MRALDPDATVWVSASAGSGKTQLLTDRVIRLMVGGAAPARILCLTFTRAAAAEMALRINKTLARYATMGDAALDHELAALLGRAAHDTERARARRLFAQVLDVPGGMSIMTIHAFCQSLLRRFPLEAELAPHFDVLDQAGQNALEAEAVTRLFGEAGAAPGSAVAGALAWLTPALDETRFGELIEALKLERARLARAAAAHGGIDGLIGAVHRRLGVVPGFDDAAICAEAAADGAFDRDRLRHTVAALDAHGGVSDKARCVLVATWLALDAPGRAARLDAYLSAFLTQDLTPRKQLATKDVIKAAPETVTVLTQEQDRLVAVVERRLSAALAANTAALLRIEARYGALYAAEKAQSAALDFDDQIEHVRRLLEDKAAGTWVLYKLDGGLDHILLDEAQDTAPTQWRVIAALAAEFFAGLGAREQGRTVFAVGDEKQSIFSFQGADITTLDAERDRLITRARAAAAPFDDVPLVRSFRSTAPVLSLVDAVFQAPEARAGVARAGQPIAHTLVREGQAGLVELWPLLLPVGAEPPDPFEAPLRQEASDDPEARFAALVARRIERWLKPRNDAERRDAWLPSRARAIRPGDIMVLVRHRTDFVPRLVADLKNAGVAVAGVDRMVVSEPLPVMDLIALGNALLLPQDDLTFATVLKSPLIGFNDDQLFALAYQRGATSLWQALTARRNETESFARAYGWFSALLARADFLPPFELFAGVLARSGRAALLARLGPEANDPIDEFLSLALAYERDHPPSLQGFLHWLRTGKAEIKRDLEQGRDEVRVITVHGAKGLQAPIVILPDTVALPKTRLKLLWMPDETGGTRLPLYSARVGNLNALGEAAHAADKQAADEEYRRLLYVALTRAEDRLYVGGYFRKDAPSANSWYRLVEAGFERLDGASRVAPPPELGMTGEAVRLESAQRKAPDRSAAAAIESVAPQGLPAWARQAPGPEPRAVRQIAASARLTAELVPRSPLEAGGGSARRRGRLIHRLLELLPDVDPGKRDESIERYLARKALGLGKDERAEIATVVRRIIDDPAFAPLLGPGSLAEVPLSAMLDGVLLTGQVDRLVVTPDRVVVIDYKTGTAVPEHTHDVPPPYVAQLAAYRAVLTRAFPGRPVACGLLFTDRPLLHWLHDSVLDAFAP